MCDAAPHLCAVLMNEVCDDVAMEMWVQLWFDVLVSIITWVLQGQMNPVQEMLVQSWYQTHLHMKHPTLMSWDQWIVCLWHWWCLTLSPCWEIRLDSPCSVGAQRKVEQHLLWTHLMNINELQRRHWMASLYIFIL